MEFDFVYFLALVQHNVMYKIMIFFVAAYPLFEGVLWISSAFFYWFRREYKTQMIENDFFPKISVVISAFNEEKYIREVINGVCALNYPDYEIIVVNDGSTDHTLEILQAFVEAGKIRLINKTTNQGKALAINDAISCTNSEILMIIDADSVPHPDILSRLVPHFKNPRVAVVTGNPCVINTSNFLTRMQLVEYTSIISMIRRSQRIWGRSMAFSGVVFAIRKSALLDVGGFSPAAATEDTELAWKLQKKFWDIFYEPSAIVWTIVPHTYKMFFKQRLRWSRGLMYVLRCHFDVMFHWKYRRMWPVFIENILATLWAVCFVVLVSLWILFAFVSLPIPPMGVSIIPATWGTVIATVTLLLCAEAFMMDKKYDRDLPRYFVYAVYYPIYYWILLSIIAVITLPALFKKPNITSKWMTRR